MFSNLRGITPEKTWIFILVYVWCYKKTIWDTSAVISRNCHRWYRMRVRKRYKVGQEVRMIYFSLPQNVNYSPPPTLRKLFLCHVCPVLQNSAVFYSSLPLSLHSGCSIWNTPFQFKVFVVQVQIFRFICAFAKYLSVCLSVRGFSWN
jgi:hypothetical protein